MKKTTVRDLASELEASLCKRPCIGCGAKFFPKELDDGQCEDCWDVAVEADPTLYLERVQ